MSFDILKQPDEIERIGIAVNEGVAYYFETSEYAK